MKVGDTVTLNHGGAYMTVVALDEGDMATCMWTDNQQMPHEIVVPVEALEIDSDEDGS